MWNRLADRVWADIHPSHAGFLPNLLGLLGWIAVLMVMIGMCVALALLGL